MRAPGAARLVFQLFTTCPGGGWVGVLDVIKAMLSPAGAWLWAELGNICCCSCFCFVIVVVVLVNDDDDIVVLSQKPSF